MSPSAKFNWVASERMAKPLFYAFAFFGFSQLLRAILAALFLPHAGLEARDLVLAFLVGLHLDAMVSLILFWPLACLVGLLPEPWWRARFVRAGLSVASFVVWCALIFLLIAEGFFFEEFQSRFNTVAIDYLIYPHEVFVNIWEVYPIPAVILGVCLLAALVVWIGWRKTWQAQASGKVGQPWTGVLIWTVTVVVLLLTYRTNETRFSQERAVNEVASNTLVSGLTAAFTRNLDYAAFYPTMPRDEAFARARKLVATPDATFVSDLNSLQRHIAGDAAKPRLNLVVLLEESLGSEFWGALGRTGVTLMPKMDALALKEGVLFDHIYADGNRTIRGYEGVFCSFPPLPGDSIVARDRSEHVETIARVLERDGYDTTFIYAGRGVFDGTGSFVKANGWSSFVELKDFKNPVFSTVWGVCNEDLYDRVLTECRERHARSLPFFMTSMSVSNHKPYTYPPGRIPEDPLQRRRANAVKYTDYALARFFEQARREPFWTNTIFAVIGDHGARVYGSQTIPIRSYEVPLLILGPAAGATPRRVPTLGCQLDVAPTLLGLIGRPYDSYFFGRDLLKWPDAPGRGLVHHNRSIGIYGGDELVVFSLNKKFEFFAGDPKREQMHRVAHGNASSSNLTADATALFQVADDLYMNRKFRISNQSQSVRAVVAK